MARHNPASAPRSPIACDARLLVNPESCRTGVDKPMSPALSHIHKSQCPDRFLISIESSLSMNHLCENVCLCPSEPPPKTEGSRGLILPTFS